MGKPKPLAIDLLETDAGTQSRLSIHEDTVTDYAELIEHSGTEWPFPPVDVFHDGNRYMVADGFHRVLAATQTKRASIPCVIHKGTATDARIFAMTANDRHGLRMTRADKRACVEWLLDNHPKMTQKAVSEAAGVSIRTVKYMVADRKAEAEKVQIAPSDDESAPAASADSDTVAAGADESIPDSETDSDGQEWEEIDDEESVVPAEESTEDQARKIRSIAHQHRDKLVRAIDDYHQLIPNQVARQKMVKLIQGFELW